MSMPSMTARGVVDRLGFLSLVLATALPAPAQSAGSLRGTVTDPTGHVLRAATVVLVNEATKFTRRVVTDAQGGYVFAAVDSGTYTLEVAADGFRTHEAKGLRMSPNDTRGLDVTLEVGARSERIEVTAERSVLQRRRGRARASSPPSRSRTSR